MTEQEETQRLSLFAGFVGLFIFVVSFLITGATYIEPESSYSIFNHFISELGHTYHSPYFEVFSIGVCLSSLFIAVFIVELGRYLESTWAKWGMRIGLISCIGCFGVGLFPSNYNQLGHLIAGLTFFCLSPVTVILFAVAMLKDEQQRISKWYILPSLIMIVNVLFLLLLPNDSVREFLFNRASFERPYFWIKPFLEWMVFFTYGFWVFLMSRHMFLAERKKE